jgi:hypothetical protein
LELAVAERYIFTSVQSQSTHSNRTFLTPNSSDFKQSLFIKTVTDVQKRCRPVSHFLSISSKLKANKKHLIGAPMRNIKSIYAVKNVACLFAPAYRIILSPLSKTVISLLLIQIVHSQKKHKTVTDDSLINTVTLFDVRQEGLMLNVSCIELSPSYPARKIQ